MTTESVRRIIEQLISQVLVSGIECRSDSQKWKEYRDIIEALSICDSALCERQGRIPLKVITIADYMHSMSNEELAEYIANTFCHGYGKILLLEWLQRPKEKELIP